MSKRLYLVISVTLWIYFFLGLLTFLTLPPIWPDETWYADIAYTFLHKGVMGTTFLAGILQSDRLPTLYPPALFYLYAAGYAVLGFSPYTQRILAFISGGLFLITVLYFCVKHLSFSTKAVAAVLLLLVVDVTFLRASHFGRPEIYIMLLHMVGYALIFSSPRPSRYALAGAVVGISALLQSFGLLAGVIIALYTLIQYRFSLKSFLLLAVFSIPVAIALLFWLYTIDFRVDLFIAAITAHAQRKYFEPGFFDQIFAMGTIWKQYYILAAILSALSALYFLLRVHTRQSLFILVGLIVSWLFILNGRQYWYGVYMTPFLYLGIASILNTTWHRYAYRIVCIVAIGSVVVVQFDSHKQLVATFGGNTYSYSMYAKAVAARIPAGSHVLLSSIPDPYFELRKDPSLTITQFIGLPGYERAYRNLLDTTDYVVYTGSHDLVYGRFLQNYLDKHTMNVFRIYHGPGEYEGYVIRLKR